jgi:phospholipid-binding lipoprotein MlaA
MSVIRIILLPVILQASLMLGGCASPNANPKDPLEGFNRGVYKFNDVLDKAIMTPVAKGYKAAVPDRGQKMIHNFFSNIDDIFVTVNDVLQLKFSQAASDFTRVWVNTIFGVFGLFNVADKLEKHNEDFGQTLGYWGVGSGPYLYLPFLGPSSVRDVADLGVLNYYGVIETYPDIATRNTVYGTELIDQRAQLLDAEKIIEGTVVDRYSYIRDAYLMRRQSLVYDGSPPRVKYDDDE